ncbi:MAG: STAS/SEC14 domain-containing protein [Deltaproteobacteria bacterium]|nr:STAS/SEC14 domain-containing protein [Deltaproteobacteria bacterium]
MKLFETNLFSFEHDEAGKILEFLWTEETAEMTADDFKDGLTRFTEHIEKHGITGALVDLRTFRFPMTKDLGPWRDEAIVPRYNASQLVRFAYLVPAGFSAPEPGYQAPGEDFETRFFESESEARAWLTVA